MKTYISTYSLEDRGIKKLTEDRINQSIKSLNDMIDQYKPDDVEQDFAFIHYSGPITASTIIKGEPPENEMPVLASNNRLTIRIGTLKEDGSVEISLPTTITRTDRSTEIVSYAQAENITSYGFRLLSQRNYEYSYVNWSRDVFQIPMPESDYSGGLPKCQITVGKKGFSNNYNEAMKATASIIGGFIDLSGGQNTLHVMRWLSNVQDTSNFAWEFGNNARYGPQHQFNNVYYYAWAPVFNRLYTGSVGNYSGKWKLYGRTFWNNISKTIRVNEQFNNYGIIGNRVGTAVLENTKTYTPKFVNYIWNYPNSTTNISALWDRVKVSEVEYNVTEKFTVSDGEWVINLYYKKRK